MKTIRQRDFQDCGVTCIEYIIEYYHGYVPIERLREDTLTNRDGTTAYHIVQTLKKYQFDSYGKKITYEDLRKDFLPAIVHIVLPNGLNHFVVLSSVRKSEVTIMDPMIGKRTLSKKDFECVWDGIILFAIPKMKIPKIPKEKSVFYILKYFANKEKKIVFLIIFCSILTSTLAILGSVYFKIGVEIINVYDPNTFWIITLIFGIMLLLRMIFEYFQKDLRVYLNKNIETNYMYAFLKHIFNLNMNKFLSYHEGDIVTRVKNAEEIKNLFQDICITFFQKIFFAVFSFITLLMLNKTLTFIVLIGMLGYCGINMITSNSFYYLILEMLEEEKKWNEHLLEAIKLFITMKHFNQTTYCMNNLEKSFCMYEKNLLQNQKSMNKYQFIRENFLELLFFVVMAFGIWLVRKENITLLNLITFQNLYIFFVNPWKELSDISLKYFYMKGIVRKISEMIHLEEEKIEEKELPLLPPSITVEKLTYSYNQTNDSIKEINLKIKSKEHLFLQGPSGCGKSTLCKILHFDIKDYQGKILLSGKNLKDYNISDIRSSVIYLSQQEVLFMGTIKENILFGSENKETFDEVCDLCKLEEIVKNRPLRYDTYINEESVSGGEKQRILLARALLKPASLYLLDECLSEVDEKLEIEIIKKIRKFLKGKTLIYISHKNHQDMFERSIVL